MQRILCKTEKKAKERFEGIHDSLVKYGCVPEIDEDGNVEFNSHVSLVVTDERYLGMVEMILKSAKFSIVDREPVHEPGESE